jgi:hypothetical protein
MKNIVFYINMILIGLVLMSASDCTPKPSQQKKEQQKVEQNMSRLEGSVDLPNLNNSLDRINTKKRLELFDDPNKISYIYLVSYGKVMAHYVIKGKVTSGNKRLTSTQRLVRGDGGQAYQDFVMESPSLDGAYGSSDSYVFFWTTEGSYVQWNGEYMVCDMPLKLSTQPQLVYTKKVK